MDVTKLNLGQNFLLVDYIPSYKVEKKSFFILFYPPTLNVICFVEKNSKFSRFCLYIYESGTVKIDCPVQIFTKMMEYLKILEYRLLVYR